MSASLDNPNPTVFKKAVSDFYEEAILELCSGSYEKQDKFTQKEIFEIIRNLNDPEHPYTLEQLKVIQEDMITIDDENQYIHVQYTPTIPHCSQATLIGLMVRVKLMRYLPQRFKVDVQITPGTHNTELAVNKQLNDKERVAAALENPSLQTVINRGISNTDRWTNILHLF